MLLTDARNRDHKMLLLKYLYRVKPRVLILTFKALKQLKASYLWFM